MAWSGRDSAIAGAAAAVGVGIAVGHAAGAPVIPLLIALPAAALPLPASPRVAVALSAIVILAMIPLTIGAAPGLAATRLTAVLFVAGTTVFTCRQRCRAERTRAELSVAIGAMQRAVLRPVPRRIGAVCVEASYVPAGRARVGGDLYDVVGAPRGVRLIIGDVMGKGHGAVERAADVLGAFRELAYHEETLQGVAIRLDAFLASRDSAEQFVTALLAEIRPAAQQTGAAPVELVNCGHPPPLLLAHGTATFADTLASAPPLGLMEFTGDWATSSSISLAPGDGLFLYTDGVTEARDRSGAFYPLVERIAAQRKPDEQRFVDTLTDDLRGHVGGALRDDATMLLVRFQPSAVPTPVLGKGGSLPWRAISRSNAPALSDGGRKWPR